MVTIGTWWTDGIPMTWAWTTVAAALAITGLINSITTAIRDDDGD